MSATAVAECEELIQHYVTSNLQHGEVVIWTEGDDNMMNGKQTRKLKKILDKHQIPYTEKNVTESTDEECISMALEMHTGYA